MGIVHRSLDGNALLITGIITRLDDHRDSVQAGHGLLGVLDHQVELPLHTELGHSRRGFRRNHDGDSRLGHRSLLHRNRIAKYLPVLLLWPWPAETPRATRLSRQRRQKTTCQAATKLSFAD